MGASASGHAPRLLLPLPLPLHPLLLLAPLGLLAPETTASLTMPLTGRESASAGLAASADPLTAWTEPFLPQYGGYEYLHSTVSALDWEPMVVSGERRYAFPSRRLLQLAPAQYSAALNLSILFFEGQRSGYLPPDQRIRWRGNSALTDGSDNGVNLVGGYYDAGDNVKFTFPMAFSMTILAWSIVQYGSELASAGQLAYALGALRWGTDYLLKAYTAPSTLFVQVGEANADHSCWERPEDMDTPRTSFSISNGQCGSDVAGETAAAMAAASIAFRSVDSAYSATLLSNAQVLWTFATSCLGSYSDVVSAVNPFYTSYSGFADELLWSSIWLYRATNNSAYFDYIVRSDATYGWSTYTLNQASWDSKIAPSDVILAQLLLTGAFPASGSNTALLQRFRGLADQFACSQIPPYNTVTISPGGHIFVGDVNNQFVTMSALLLLVYSDALRAAGQPGVFCSGSLVSTDAIVAAARRQVDYILGDNPLGRSFMVGFGPAWPSMLHHRGASLPSIFTYPARIACKEGYGPIGYYNPGPDPNTLYGAVVGGPNAADSYSDARSNYLQNEPTTYTNAAIVGPLARLSAGP